VLLSLPLSATMPPDGCDGDQEVLVAQNLLAYIAGGWVGGRAGGRTDGRTEGGREGGRWGRIREKGVEKKGGSERDFG